MRWEKFKSFLLVSLMISSFVLTGIFMFESTSGLEDSKLTKINLPLTNIELSEIAHPQGLYINFGGASHTAFFFNSNNLWGEVINYVKKSFVEYQPVETEEKLWNTVLKEKSIRVKFANGISSNEIFKVQHEIDIEFEEILIPLLGRGFILVKSNDKYYKITASMDSNLESLVNEIEISNYIEFKTIEKRFSIQTILEENNIDVNENLTIIPIETAIGLSFYKSNYLIDTFNKDIVEKYAKKIFGHDLSFVKKMITYDETVIYLSNFGKRLLSFSSNGIVEYINNVIIQNESLVENDSEKMLTIAWSFINYFEENTEGVYLLDSKYEEGINKYYFNSFINHFPIYYYGNEFGQSIEVHIKNNEVVYYKSNRRIDFEIINVDHMWKDGLSFSKIFDINFDIISDNYKRDMKVDKIDDMKIYIFEIVNAIEVFDFEYFIDSETRSNNFVPAWKIKIADTIYHFDMYEGVLLGVEEEYVSGLEKN